MQAAGLGQLSQSAIFSPCKRATCIHPWELEVIHVYILRCREREPLIHLILRGKKLQIETRRQHAPYKSPDSSSYCHAFSLIHYTLAKVSAGSETLPMTSSVCPRFVCQQLLSIRPHRRHRATSAWDRGRLWPAYFRYSDPVIVLRLYFILFPSTLRQVLRSPAKRYGRACERVQFLVVSNTKIKKDGRGRCEGGGGNDTVSVSNSSGKQLGKQQQEARSHQKYLELESSRSGWLCSRSGLVTFFLMFEVVSQIS